MKNKNILFVFSGLRFEKDEGAKNRLNSFIESYSNEGYKITVLVFFPCSSFRYIFSKSKFLSSKAKWFLLPNIPISKNKLLSMLSALYVKVVIGLYTRINQYDLIQSEVLAFGCKYVNKKCCIIVDFHGDSVSECLFNYGKSRIWLSKLMKKWQKESLLIATHVIVVSENLKLQIEENTGLEIQNYSIISCGVDYQRFISSDRETKFDNIISNRIVLGYCGGLQKWQNIDKIIDIIFKLQQKDMSFFFMLYTNSPIEQIRIKLEQLGRENYLVVPLKSCQVPSHLKILDAGFLLRENVILNKVSSPTKILEYLASGVPVICNQYSGDFERSLHHRDNGFVLESIDLSDEELADLFKYLYTVKFHRNDFKIKCVQAASYRTWKIEFDIFYRNMINKK